MNYDKATSDINKYFDEEVSMKILEGIKEFTTIYVNVNECPYISDDIFNSKLSELLHFFEKSEYIIEGINDNTIDPSNLCNMKPHELNPEKYQTIIERKTYEMKKKKQKGTTTFSCKKCKNNNCDVTQKQTRAADEPATTIVTCLECGFTFRF
jgi:DNA-directed RNA polymerase subunit M/transcription elongation factor TFIIS